MQTSHGFVSYPTHSTSERPDVTPSPPEHVHAYETPDEPPKDAPPPPPCPPNNNTHATEFVTYSTYMEFYKNDGVFNQNGVVTQEGNLRDVDDCWVRTPGCRQPTRKSLTLVVVRVHRVTPEQAATRARRRFLSIDIFDVDCSTRPHQEHGVLSTHYIFYTILYIFIILQIHQP